jgi:hypothetical protein
MSILTTAKHMITPPFHLPASNISWKILLVSLRPTDSPNDCLDTRPNLSADTNARVENAPPYAATASTTG